MIFLIYPQLAQVQLSPQLQFSQVQLGLLHPLAIALIVLKIFFTVSMIKCVYDY